MLKVNEIFFSIQGESTLAGLPCIFIRLTYCNLRCSYCDTEYAFFEGTEMSIDEILSEVKKYYCKLVEVTGGEPLVQQESLQLLKILCDCGYDVMLETSGSLPIAEIDKRVKIIMDLKTPSSGMMNKNLFSNIDFLKPTDEIKFVIGDREDYQWSKQIINKFKLTDKFIVLMGCVFEKLQPTELAKWILEDNLNVRLQLQLHKFIWDSTLRGV